MIEKNGRKLGCFLLCMLYYSLNFFPFLFCSYFAADFYKSMKYSFCYDSKTRREKQVHHIFRSIFLSLYTQGQEKNEYNVNNLWKLIVIIKIDVIEERFVNIHWQADLFTFFVLFANRLFNLIIVKRESFSVCFSLFFFSYYWKHIMTQNKKVYAEEDLDYSYQDSRKRKIW